MTQQQYDDLMEVLGYCQDVAEVCAVCLMTIIGILVAKVIMYAFRGVM